MKLFVATESEFRQRFWLFGGLFGAAFSTSFIDHRPFAMLIARTFGGNVDLALRVVLGVSALLVLAAAALRTWARAYLRTDVVHDSAIHADRLVADGPYRQVRNPLYLGTLLMAAGFSLLAPLPGCVL